MTRPHFALLLHVDIVAGDSEQKQLTLINAIALAEKRR